MGTHHGSEHAGPAGGTPPPGWYPEPADATLWRWWDGGHWTAHTWDVGVAQRDVDERNPPEHP